MRKRMSISENRFEIKDIGWERVFLSFTVATACEEEVDFVLERIRILSLERTHDIRIVDTDKKVPLKWERKEGTSEGAEYHFCCNVAAFDGRQFLENGIWKLTAVNKKDKEDRAVCLVSHESAYRFEDLSRVFRYGKSRYSYTVSFGTYTIEEKELAFEINSRFMKTWEGWHTRHYVEEARTIKGKTKNFSLTVIIALIRLFYQFFEHLFPKNGTHILLMSETHDYLWGNLKAIDDAVKARGLDKKYKIDYNFRKAAGSHQSTWSWVKLVYKLAKQDVIFVDDYVPIFGFLKLNKRTKLVQVWHAGEGFKAVGYCRFGKDGSPYPAGSCHKQYDYVLTGSKKLVKVFAEVFGIEEEAFLPVGMPRLDGFLDEQHISEFKEGFYQEYPDLQGKKVIMFAPTYRGTGQKSAYYDYNWLDLKAIYDYCGEDKVFMIKMHPFVTVPIEIPEEYSRRIVDFSSYPNINDLYYITDLLITDYSSNYFEYSLLERPCLFFTPDRELYEISRGVHRSVKDSAPGKVCDSFEEMMEALYKEDFGVEKIRQFVKDNFGEYDGKATERVIEKLFN